MHGQGGLRWCVCVWGGGARNDGCIVSGMCCGWVLVYQ